MYVCIDCGREVNTELAVARKVQCPYCGFRIIRKLRSSTIKRVGAI